MILEIDKLSFSINKKFILKDISFKVKRGQYISIIGPNGAGKSTLLKNITRIYKHDEGLIKIKGKNLSEYKQKNLAKLVSYVPQAGGWIPPFSVEELLSLSRYPYNMGSLHLEHSDKMAIKKALSLTGLEAFSKRKLRTLSGGERQKVFLAAALAQEAELILLDEPASFLDPKHAADLNKLLAKLNQENNLSMLTVTHDLNHPLSLDGSILVLKDGQQLFYGSSEKLLEAEILEKAYQHEFIYFQHPKSNKIAVLAE